MQRITNVKYIPQYEDLNNTATLRLTNEIVLTVIKLHQYYGTKMLSQLMKCMVIIFVIKVCMFV